MNPWLDAGSALNHYYDADFPSKDYCAYPENFDATVAEQGLRDDVPRYLELASAIDGPILEPCCGTGRVALPLAAAGHRVVGVDFSDELIRQFESKLARQPQPVRDNITIINQDITALDLPERHFELAIIAFNSLLCIDDFEAQCAALAAVSRHLAPGGRLVLDLVNPWLVQPQGDAVPKPFFSRRNPQSGRRYTRFAALGAFDANQRQELWGWYDEIDESGRVLRRPYSVTWRLVYPFELRCMLDRSNLRLTRLEGTHRGDPFTAASPRLFVHAARSDTEEMAHV